jgi:hypothetical protein
MPESAASLLNPVAKWLCQNSVIFSLQRTPRVDHPEHPALSRVVDVDVR